MGNAIPLSPEYGGEGSNTVNEQRKLEPKGRTEFMASPKVAVIVPVYGKLPLTVRFLDSFRRVQYDNYEMVIVDDASPDGTEAHLAENYPWATVLRGNGDLWWAGGTNEGVRYALERKFDYVLTINNDTLVDPGFLGRLVETAQANPRSVVGARINFLEEPTRVWAVGGYTNWRLNNRFFLNLCEHYADERELLPRRPSPSEVELLTGCGVLVPARCYQDIGLYDQRNCPQYHADSEFTLRASRHGYRLLVDLHAVLWNDVPNTCVVKHIGLQRSPWYWRPLLAIHLRYCPWQWLLLSLWRQFRDILIDQFYPAEPGDPTPPMDRVKKAVERLLLPRAA
jgi:GT2 family glycosyltransferase